MWFQRGEAVVLHGHGLGHDLRDPALAFADQAAVLFAVHPILDVEMDRPLLGKLPTLPGIKAAVHVVRRIVDGAEVADVGLLEDCFQQVLDALGVIAVDAVLVLVDEADVGLFG